MKSRLERFAAEMEANRTAAFAEQFKKIDEQLASIRSSESVNQQLFDGFSCNDLGSGSSALATSR